MDWPKSRWSVLAVAAIVTTILTLRPAPAQPIERPKPAKRKRKFKYLLPDGPWSELTLPSNPAPDVVTLEGRTQALYNAILHMCRMTLRAHDNVHYESNCSRCSRSDPVIRGVRYVCTQCANVDLCEHCEGMNFHDKSHILYKIPYHIPPQLEDVSLYRNQIPWQPEYNTILRESLETVELISFDKLQEYTQKYSMNPAEIDAVFDQFRYLVTYEYPWNNNWFGEKYAIEIEEFRDVLPTRYCPRDAYLFSVLFALYDWDDDGKINFPDFIRATSLIIGTDNRAKLSRLLQVCRRQDLDFRSALRRVLLDYTELAKNAFADASNILSLSSDPSKLFDKQQEQQNRDEWAARAQTATEAMQQDLIFEERSEVSTWATYDPVTKDAPETDLDMELLWGFSIEDFLSQIFDPFEEEPTLVELEEAISANPKYLGPIIGCLEAGIL